MCLSTSRGELAQDGDKLAHSPFATELLDAGTGIFAPGVTLKQGIENACKKMFEDTRQRPVCVALERLPAGFCLIDSSEGAGAGKGDGKAPALEDAEAVMKMSHGQGAGHALEGQSMQGASSKSPQDSPPKRRAEQAGSRDGGGMSGGTSSKKSKLEGAEADSGGGGACFDVGASVQMMESLRRAFPFDVFISHAWGNDGAGRDNHERAKRLSAGLERLGLKPWLDEARMQGNILNRMAEGIEGSAVVLICVTRNYMDKVAQEGNDNCKREFEYAYQKRTTLNMLPVVMEDAMADTSAWRGSLGLALCNERYYKLVHDKDAEFDQAVQEIAAGIRKKLEAVLQGEVHAVAGAMSSRSVSPSPSDDQSQTSTRPQSPRSPSSEVIALHASCDTVSEFREDIKAFIQGFLDGRPGQRRWKVYE